ncbi:MAG TPA: ATP-binding protein [Clostridia bacterium]|nr:ATP-binding protein [Clostridia bacterium]
MKKYELSPSKLKFEMKYDVYDFETTADLMPLKGIIGQERASKSLDFGLSIGKPGYNIYVSGQSGTGRSSYVRLLAEKKAQDDPVPNDWVYVYNFKNPNSPIALSVKPGLGKVFVEEMNQTIKIIRKEMGGAFATKSYEDKKNRIILEFQNKSKEMLKEINEVSKKYGFVFSQTEHGLISMPLNEGRPMTEEEYKNLDEKEAEDLKKKSNELNIETVDIFNSMKGNEELLRNRLKELDEKTGEKVVAFHMTNLERIFAENEDVSCYLEKVVKDIVANIENFKKNNTSETTNPFAMMQMRSIEVFFERYRINLFVDNSEVEHAPVIEESNPSYYNLMGSVEYKNEMGVMKTDFMQIKPGAIHQANGGYLILKAKDLLLSPHSWVALKRALSTKKAVIESLGKELGFVATTTIKPKCIPIDLKVILIGDPYTYYLLYAYDEEFKKLFKVMADFDIEMNRDNDNMLKMARFIATHTEKENLRHFDRRAVQRVVEYSSRLADNQKKLSSRFNKIVEILYEADSWAEVAGAEVVGIDHIKKAIREKDYRSNKYEEKVMEMFEDGIYLLDVEGEKIGEINGLAIVGMGDYSFGKPNKITVATYKGKSGIISIDREVRATGKIHDKGVLILDGYIGHKYAQEKRLSLSASIVFEQLYSGLEGDSASSTELYALLSSLAQVPIKQCIAVTGSVNQRGEIQPIGGVNEKIEGFYKVCKMKGLTGEQGVVIPHQNVSNLMLMDEVVQAVDKGLFHIYSVETIDQGIEILTGVAAGESDEKGKYQEGTIHHLVHKRFIELASGEKDEEKNESGEKKEDD